MSGETRPVEVVLRPIWVTSLTSRLVALAFVLGLVPPPPVPVVVQPAGGHTLRPMASVNWNH